MPLAQQEQTAYAYDLQGNLDLQTNPNGVITDYTYDDLNRLTDLVHYLPDETPESLADNDKLAEFAYTVREDGRRTQATEKFWFDSAVHENNITWTYDDAGRLIDEVLDHYDNDLDQTQHFTYDLVGNRLLRTVDEGNDSDIDQVFASEYDANDRLLTEEADTNNDSIVDQTTTYGYTGTQQTSKTVTAGSTTISTTEYEYNLDGRLGSVTITTHTAGSPSRVEKTTYGYDHTGIRVSTLFEVDADVNESFEEQTKTTYLIDQHNFTGYQQVLEATVTNAVTGDLIKRVVYTIGHDQIAQTTFTPTGDSEGETLVFHMDGHGSTRVVTDLVATILQIFAYDAFGVAIGFEEAQALTEYLYNNEQLDVNVGLQYLRRRFYDAAIGRFPQLDEFTGNNRDPQSYHKYTFTSGDPVQFNDPTGLFEGLIGLIGAMNGSMNARGQDATASVNGLHTGVRLQRLVRIVEKLHNALQNIQDAIDLFDNATNILELTSKEKNDLKSSFSILSFLPAVRVGPIGITIPQQITKKLQFLIKLARSFGGLSFLQQQLGEWGAAIAANSVGLEHTKMSLHGPQGIDQLRYLDAGPASFWAIIEAKGGRGRLGEVTSYGPQMSSKWITHWLDDTIDRNCNHPERSNLVEFRTFAKPMLAAVVRVNMEGKTWQVKITAQTFNWNTPALTWPGA